MRLFRLSLLEWVVVVAILAVLLGILMRPIVRMWKEEVPRVCRLMVKIYTETERGYSREDILEEMSRREKELVRKHRVAWDSDVFPVKTTRGTLKPMFYPHDHVVVYAEPYPYGEHNVRVAKFVTGRGQVHGRQKVSDLEELISITRFGTSEILLGTIDDINEVPATVDVNSYPQVYGYLLLKRLMARNNDFLKYALLLASRKEPWTNNWVASILQSAVIAPPLPELDTAAGHEDSFIASLSNWCYKNQENITMTNGFLFEHDGNLSEPQS